MVIIYLAKTLYFRVLMFFKRWYVSTFFKVYWNALRMIDYFERKIAVRANAHFLFKPLYQEYNIVGYVLGFVFRFFRIGSGYFLYFLIILFSFIFYVCWALLPIFLIYKIING
jgi:hypothetical protein